MSKCLADNVTFSTRCRVMPQVSFIKYYIPFAIVHLCYYKLIYKGVEIFIMYSSCANIDFSYFKGKGDCSIKKNDFTFKSIFNRNRVILIQQHCYFKLNSVERIELVSQRLYCLLTLWIV